MDYFGLAQAALLGFVGLSILTVSVGLTVRLFLGPVLSDVADRIANRPKEDQGLLGARLDQLDERLANIENGLERIEVAQDFDKRLGSGPRKTESG